MPAYVVSLAPSTSTPRKNCEAKLCLGEYHALGIFGGIKKMIKKYETLSISLKSRFPLFNLGYKYI